MKFGKKQLVLASLVLALGAAVYLNWQFAGTNRLPVGESSEESSQLGAAQLVNNAYVETVNDGLEANASSESGESGALSQARLDRQAARDEALDLLDEVLKDVESDSAAKQQAVDQASAIAENILEESNVESLLEAKGYTDCVAYITSEECSVVVSGALEDSDTLIVQEVVMEQTGLTADKIKIIGTNRIPPRAVFPVELENMMLEKDLFAKAHRGSGGLFYYFGRFGYDKKGSQGTGVYFGV